MDQREIKKNAYLALLAGCAINIFYGIKMSWSLFGSALIAENGFTALQASMPFSVQTVVSTLAVIGFGRLVDKGFKPRYVVMLCGTFTGVGLILCGLSTSWISVLIGCGVFIGCGSGMGTGLTVTVLKWWSGGSKKGTATGLLQASTSFNSIVLTPFINMMLVALGMRKTCALCGGLVVIVVCILAQLIRPVPDEVFEVMQKEKKADAGSDKKKAVRISPYDGAAVSEFVRTKQFAVWLVLYGVVCMSGLVASSQIGNIATSMEGWPSELTWLSVSLVGLGGFIGRLHSGMLSDKFSPLITYAFVAFGQVVICLLFPLLGNVAMMCAGILVIAYFYGGAIANSVIASTELFGITNSGTLLGLNTIAYSVAGFFGPTLAAVVKDSTGSYTPVFYTLAALSLIGFFIAVYLEKWLAKNSVR